MRYLFILIVLISTPAFSGTYYVAPSGSGTACTDVAPCAATYAMANAIAGDVWLFQDGIYTVQMTGNYLTPVLTPSNSGTAENPITFRSATQYGANIHGVGTENPLAQASASTYVSTMIGSYQKNYITWDGFKLTARNFADTADIFAMARFQGSIGCKIINSELIGGTHDEGGAANSAGIFFELSTYLTIENNKIHEYIESSDNPNNGGIEGFDSAYVTVKNNEIYNTTAAIHFKDNIDDSQIYNNYIHDNYTGIVIRNMNSGGSCERNTVSNNVISANAYFGIEVGDNIPEVGNDTIIYNNTIHGNTSAGHTSDSVAISLGRTDSGHHPKIYNNILSESAYSLSIRGITNQIAECDHNQWTATLKIWTHKYEDNTATYTALASWQASAGLESGADPGGGDLATAPGFATSPPTALAHYAVANTAGRSGGLIGADIRTVGIDAGNTDITAPVTSLSTTTKLSAKTSVTLTANESATVYACTAPTDTCTPAEVSAPVTVYPGSYLRYYSIDTATNEETLRSQYYGWSTLCK